MGNSVFYPGSATLAKVRVLPGNNILGLKILRILCQFDVVDPGWKNPFFFYPGSATLATVRVLPGDAVFSEDLILLPHCRPIQPPEVSLHRPLQHILRQTFTTSGFI
jgi:hypothetical protein